MLLFFHATVSDPVHVLQPYGPGKYVFDIGCEQHGEYEEAQQVIQRKIWF